MFNSIKKIYSVELRLIIQQHSILLTVTTTHRFVELLSLLFLLLLQFLYKLVLGFDGLLVVLGLLLNFVAGVEELQSLLEDLNSLLKVKILAF